jgi:hypothetical protein
MMQGFLFPELERDHGPLDDTMRKLVAILEVLDVERFVHPRHLRCDGKGRPPDDRGAIARAFVAKAFLKIPDTRALITRLKTTPSLCRICGFDSTSDVPEEWTFSRAFAEFAACGLTERTHESLVREVYDERIVGHANRDSSEIEGREKPVKKPPKAKRAPRRRGRPRKDEVRDLPEVEKRVNRQRAMALAEMIDDLPKDCDVGSKRDSKGHAETWIGYKIHADVADCGMALSLLLTSASLHDSQVAIPLMTMTRGRVTHLYENMDAAYDCAAIRDHSIAGGQIPIIDSNPRRGEKKLMDPAKDRRYDERTTVERFFGRLKDEFGGRFVMVRGFRKVMTHLMFGVLALTGDCVLKLAN